MRQDEILLQRPGFGFGGIGHEHQLFAQQSVICGRASTWQPPGALHDDDGFEPTIVRGRE